jgi:hypothetical protein
MDRLGALQQPGIHEVDVPISCVITRFGLRSPRHLLPTYRDYRELTREVSTRRPGGLLRSAFLVEGASSCCTLSVWSGPPRFSAAVPLHVEIARSVFGRLTVKERGPELWSTTWRLASVSNNLNWADFDLRRHIVEHMD